MADYERKYIPAEKVALALRMAAKKLRPYFQAHPITVLSHIPLRSLLHSPDASGRMVKRALELAEYGVEYEPHSTVKWQILADFATEISVDQGETEPEWCWILKTDGSARQGRGGAGITLTSPTGEKIVQAVRRASHQ